MRLPTAHALLCAQYEFHLLTFGSWANIQVPAKTPMQTEMIHFDPSCDRKRWVAYFDLLGTKELIRSNRIFEVFVAYAQAIEHVSRELHQTNTVQHAWFSDTFLMYSDDDSASGFTVMDHVARWFIQHLVTRKIPVRGAISSSDFYADRNHGMFFGKALVEAYEYGEAQDWIGYLLCPSAVIRLDEVGLPANERLNYAYADIPYKKPPKNAVLNLPACILGRWACINDQNKCVSSLREMKSAISDQSIIRKYDNAICFIESNRREPLSSIGDSNDH